MKNRAWIFLTVATLYLAGSLSIYRFRHPQKTETQLFLEIPRALLWRNP